MDSISAKKMLIAFTSTILCSLSFAQTATTNTSGTTQTNIQTNTTTQTNPATVAQPNTSVTDHPTMPIAGPLAPSTVDDTAIAANVQNKITQDAKLAGSNITVASSNGVITLSGSASTQAQIDDAIKTAKMISGVKEVKSTVTIANTTNTATGPTTP